MRLRLGLILLAMACALGIGLVAHPQPHDRGVSSSDSTGQSSGADQSHAPNRSGQPRQTSDGEPGEIAVPVQPFLRARTRITHDRSWKVAPGVKFRRWVQTNYRVRVHAFLLTAKLAKPGVSVQYGEMKHVPDRATVPTLVKRAHGVGGVNGGFFDIYDTGAPLGVGVDRRRGFRHAASETWYNTFSISRDGHARIGPLRLQASIREYPQVRITNYNSPRVRAGSIGIYTHAWGDSSGFSITDGQTKQLRTVLVAGGRVVANRAGVTKNLPVRGTLLVGRGKGADQLAGLPVGTQAHVRWSLPSDPAMAIGGETILLRKGKVLARDDSILHPRTAVGIDRDRGRIMLLVIDGRTESSDGYTLVQLAKMMKSLGAESALNFDGGGSSTLVAKRGDGRVRVRNNPSDGSLRAVGDALVFRYDKP